MKIICSLLGLAITVMSFGQTVIPGGIYSNTTWTQEGSPYIIISNVVIAPKVTLTIEPGVEIRFDGRYYLEIRGILKAVGTENDTIKFSSNNLYPQKQDWIGTKLSNYENARASFEYCKFSDADIANNVECCGSGYFIYFKNCSFRSNNIAMMGYYGNKISVDHCEFRNNNVGILDGEKIITYSSFIENDYGLYNSTGSDVYNSTFLRNRVGYHGMRGIISNCLISENEIGVAPLYTNPDVIHSIISNNLIGIQVQGLYLNEPGVIKESKICNNAIFNIELLDSANIDLTTNCWCELDSSIISEKIYDGHDDILLGFASIGLQGIDCEHFAFNNIKETGTEIVDFKIYPNPVTDNLKIKCETCFPGQIKNARIFIYNSTGQLVLLKSVSFSTLTELDLSHLKTGTYFLKILINTHFTKYVIIKI